MKVGIFYDNVAAICPQGAQPSEVVKKLAKTDADYMEINLNILKEQDTAFFDLCRSLGLGFHVCEFVDRDGKLKNGDSVEVYFPFLQSLEIRNLLLVYAYGTEVQALEETRRYSVPILNDLCEKAKRYGITLMFEDFDGTEIPCGGIGDLLWYGERIPALGFTFDTGNFAYFGEDCLAALERVKKKVVHVHVKDRISSDNLASAVTGEGYLPIFEIVNILRKTGYSGDFTCEMYGLTDYDGMVRAVNNVKKMTESPLFD